MIKSHLRINSERLQALLNGINQFGHNPVTGGYNRIGFSPADRDVRQWFADQMRRDGLAVTSDSAGNLFGRLGDVEAPCIMVGSHLDTVPEGGAFDGALGAAVGLECVRCIMESGLCPTVPIVAVATSEEEGRFGGMLGSQAISGQLEPGWATSAMDADGVRLSEAMRSSGYDPDQLGAAAWGPDHVKAFLELHIEQGPILEAAHTSVGIVEGVSGVLVLSVELTGVANHSGTTPMHLRSDAFAGLAQMAAAIPELIDAYGTDQSRITIGKVTVEPNFPHTIPGHCSFTVIIRDLDVEVMRRLKAHLEKIIKDVSDQHHLSCTMDQTSFIAPTSLDETIRTAFVREAEALNYPYQIMPSGAGHDAQTMQTFCPSGLIFVPSKGGVSHAPEEWTDWADIERGAQLMLNTIVRLVDGERG